MELKAYNMGIEFCGPSFCFVSSQCHLSGREIAFQLEDMGHWWFWLSFVAVVVF